jgi:hypothetical protein
MRFSLGDKEGAERLLAEGLALYDRVDNEADEAVHFRTLRQNLLQPDGGCGGHRDPPQSCGN